MEADVVVIGSGIGGLTAAAVLAKSLGKRVVVVERHFTPGGQTHAFVRGPHRWDVGLHYVSAMPEGSTARAWFDYITDGQVAWAPLPPAYDHFVYPDVAFSVPTGREAYRDKLIAAFPHERAGICTYFDDLNCVAESFAALSVVGKTLPRVFEAAAQWWYARAMRLSAMTTGAYMDSVFKDAQLKRVVLSHWGDYGIPPHASAFGIHALVTHSFFDGACVPVGGAGRLFEATEAVIERYGGFTIVNHEVVAIRTVPDASAPSGRRVTGVTVRDRAAANAAATFDIAAPVVVSDAGVQITYGQLLKELNLFESELKQIAGMTGNSAVTVFLGLKASPATLGVKGENWWMYNGVGDHDQVFAGAVASLIDGPVANFGFLSFPSLKTNAGAQTHEASVTALVPYDEFRRFAASRWRHRPAEYEAIKERMGQHLLALAEKYVPGLSALVSYVEVATPLTYAELLSRDNGWFYGTPATPARLQLKAHSCVTPVAGLFLAGEDAATLGILGATAGGVVAAAAVRGGLTGLITTFAAIQRNAEAPAPKQEQAATAAEAEAEAAGLGRVRVTLVNKVLVAPKTYFLELHVASPIHVAGGQYVQLRVAPGTYRSYSIAAYDPAQQRLGLLITTTPGGPGSVFVEACKVGDTTFAWTPMGTFTLAPPVAAATSTLLIGTGTGLAPLLLMVRDLLAARSPAPRTITLLFGCRTREDDYCAAMLQRCFPDVWQSAVDVHVCVSRETAAAAETPSAAGTAMHAGRVTAYLQGALARGEIDLGTTDAYLCGNLHMVSEIKRMLGAAGVQNIFTESF